MKRGQSERRHAYAVVDVETEAVLSRHRTAAAARAGRGKWGQPTRVAYTARRVGEAKSPAIREPFDAPNASDRTDGHNGVCDADIADAFTARCLAIFDRYTKS